MHKSALAFAAVAFVALTGCGVATEAESTGETSAAVGELGSPPAVIRRLVRKATTGCSTVYGDGGKWTGEAVAGPYQSSGYFCAYSWSTGTKADPDLAKLDEIAMYDTYLTRRFNVPDPRSSNEDAVKVTMTKYTPLVSPFPSDLPITNPGDPTPRSSGCDVCVSPNGLYLWFVLPPEARDHVLYAKSKAGTLYALGKGTDVAIFALKDASLGDEVPILTWEP